MEFWKRWQEEKKDFEDRVWGGTQEKKTSKIARRWPFLGPLPKTQKPKWQKPTPPPTKKGRVKNTFLHLEQQPTIFGKCSVPVQLTPFISAIAVLCWKHYKNSVFSTAHTCQFLSITDTDTPFRHPFHQPPLWKEGCIFWKLPWLTILPMFVVLFIFETPPKSIKLPKQLCAPKIPLSRDHQKQLVLSCFSKKSTSSKIHPFSTTLKSLFYGHISDLLFFFFALFCLTSYKNDLFFFEKHNFRSGSVLCALFCTLRHDS